jgi:hypothetical protein
MRTLLETFGRQIIEFFPSRPKAYPPAAIGLGEIAPCGEEFVVAQRAVQAKNGDMARLGQCDRRLGDHLAELLLPERFGQTAASSRLPRESTFRKPARQSARSP